MELKIAVLAKQVPDTKNVGPEAMTPEGTVNRGALPAIFNPDDMNALEQALRLKEQYPGSTITMITMGLPKATEVLREGLYRGVDKVVLLTDRALGGADTLATSYTLAQGIKKAGSLSPGPSPVGRGDIGFDIILCGRQAIDGDTAQVGPQVAEKLGLTQITYAEEILSIREVQSQSQGQSRRITVRRHIDGGSEVVEGPLPIVLTVNGSAAPCRSRNAKLACIHKKTEPIVWGAADIDADPAQIGKAGSPTNVKAVKNIVFKAKETRQLTGSDADIEGLIVELLESNTIG